MMDNTLDQILLLRELLRQQFFILGGHREQLMKLQLAFEFDHCIKLLLPVLTLLILHKLEPFEVNEEDIWRLL